MEDRIQHVPEKVLSHKDPQIYCKIPNQEAAKRIISCLFIIDSLEVVADETVSHVQLHPMIIDSPNHAILQFVHCLSSMPFS